MRSFPVHLAPRTLRGRLSLIALTTAALLMTVLTVVFNTMVDRHLRHQADDELRTRADAVATTVDTSGSRVRVLETANDQFLDANVWIYAGTHLLEQPTPTAADSPLTRAAARLTAQGSRACATVHAPSACAPGPYPAVTPPWWSRPWTSLRTGTRPTPCCWDRSSWTA